MSLWSVNKKKPLCTVKQAHGRHGDAGLEQPHWVASVAALQNSDTVASGASGCEGPPYQLFNMTHTFTSCAGRIKFFSQLSFMNANLINIINELLNDELIKCLQEPICRTVDAFMFSLAIFKMFCCL